jgi:hypothetical protein
LKPASNSYGCVRQLAGAAGNCDCADRVGRQRHHLGARPELALEVVEIERRVIMQFDVPDDQITAWAHPGPLVRLPIEGPPGGGLAVGIASTIRALRPETKIFTAEPETGAALALAAVLSGQAGSGTVVCVVSGGNINLDKLAGILTGDTG